MHTARFQRLPRILMTRPMSGSANPFDPPQISSEAPATGLPPTPPLVRRKRPIISQEARNAQTVLASASEDASPRTQRPLEETIEPGDTSVIPGAAMMGLLGSKRKRVEDPVFVVPPLEDPLLHLLSSLIMRHGKRAAADRRVSRLLLHINAMTRSPPLPILRQAINMVSPFCRTLNHKSPAGKIVSKPTPLSDKQSKHQGIMWLVERSKAKDGVNIEERLAKEVISVIQGESEALKDKLEAHRFAMVNRGNVMKTRTTM